MTEQKTSRGRHGWWAWLRLVLFGLFLTIVTGTVMALPLLPGNRVVLEAGDVASEDIHAPRQVTYESVILQQQEQDRAAGEVQAVYTDVDPAIARQQIDRLTVVLDYIDAVRADSLASDAQRRGWIMAVPELDHLSTEEVNALLGLTNEEWDQVKAEVLASLDQMMRREIRAGALGAAYEELASLISLGLSGTQSDVVTALAESFLVANTFLDPVATAEAQAQAREQVGPVLRTFEEGEIIIREGERVTDLHIEVLNHLGLRKTEVQLSEYFGVGLFASLITVILFLYLARFQPDALWEWRWLVLLTLAMSAFVIGAGLMVPGGDVLRYLSPAPALAILLAAAIGPQAGVASAIFLGCLVGVVADGSIEMVTYTALGGIVAALTVGRVERIADLFRAGAFVAIAQILVVLAFQLVEGTVNVGETVLLSAIGLLSAGVSASLALGCLFLVGPLFDMATTIRLMELNRPVHPLLQRLLREAPASYHHSIMVANLAEQAAERIDADTLLTRVGAYYHDIGKIVRPYFFAENQAEGVNPHDRLDPQTSAEVIISHVQDGIAMAKRYHLPSRVRAFIPEHHGTTWVSFLYRKAVEQAGDPSLVDENRFRHIGPKPQSKETALVMLADGCEAAVRAVRPTTPEEVAEMVNRVIDERVVDGQLDDCDMTLRDLGVVRDVFYSALKGIYHPRIQYPPDVDL